MPFDFVHAETRAEQGRKAYQDGLAAEDIVQRDYLSRGYELLAERWRGPGGEVDLIFQGPEEVVFVEVKKAKTHDIAVTRLSEKQLWRIARSAEAYVTQICNDPFMAIRLDLALTDWAGTVAIRENLVLY
ncbi:MAG: YraN family protein [Pseudomonadota bacterium]